VFSDAPSALGGSQPRRHRVQFLTYWTDYYRDTSSTLWSSARDLALVHHDLRSHHEVTDEAVAETM
jgi:hypothetical protein